MSTVTRRSDWTSGVDSRDTRRDTGVTRVRDTRIGDDAATRTIVESYAAEIARFREDAPAVVDEVMQRHGWCYARARALGMPHRNQDPGSDLDPQGAEQHDDPDPDRHAALTDEIIRACDPDLDLARVSLTMPREREHDLAPCMHAYAGQIADAGAAHGALLVLDLRPRNLAPHAYGLVASDHDARRSLIDRWCALTGADPRAHAGSRTVQTIGGWPTYRRTGNVNSLRRHLGHVLAYALRDLPGGIVRDLDADVAASGALDGPWSAFRARGAGSGRPPSVSRLDPIGVGVTSVTAKACVVCGGPLRGMRLDALACSPRCRQRRRRSTTSEHATPPAAKKGTTR